MRVGAADGGETARRAALFRKGERMFQVYRKELMWGGRRLTLETGRIARQADGAVLATYGETTVLCTAVAMKTAEARAGFLPADRQLPGKDLCRRQDPRRLLQARGPAVGEGDAGLAPHRPADPAAVRAGLPQRDAGRLHRAVHDLENDPDIVALVGASAALTISGIPFLWADRRRARRLYRRRSTCSTRRWPSCRARSSTSSSPAPPKAC